MAKTMTTFATFDGATHTLTIGSQTFVAHNNVDSKAKGKWPNGTFSFERTTEHRDDAADSAYGTHGNVIFTVPGRTNMGVHSGRTAKADGRGRHGPEHATMGCIRSTDAAVQALRLVVKKGFTLKVINN